MIMLNSSSGVIVILACLILYSSPHTVSCEKTGDDDTIGMAFGGLFKAILQVLKSEFETTKDFVPGLDQIVIYNDTRQNGRLHVNDTMAEVLDEQKSVDVDMNVGDTPNSIQSDQLPTYPSVVAEDDESTMFITGDDQPNDITNEPSTDNKVRLSFAENDDIQHDIATNMLAQGTDIDKEEAVMNLTHHKILNETSITQNMKDEVGDIGEEVPVVSFAEGIAGKEIFPVLYQLPNEQEGNAWPFQPSFKDMLGVVEGGELNQEIISPGKDYQSQSDVGEQGPGDGMGFIHAYNMTAVDIANEPVADNYVKSGVGYDNTTLDSASSDYSTTDNIPSHPEPNKQDTQVYTDTESVTEGGIKQEVQSGSKDMDVSFIGDGLPLPHDHGGDEGSSGIDKAPYLGGEDNWPFQPVGVNDMIGAVEERLDHYGISKPGKQDGNIHKQDGEMVDHEPATGMETEVEQQGHGHGSDLISKQQPVFSDGKTEVVKEKTPEGLVDNSKNLMDGYVHNELVSHGGTNNTKSETPVEQQSQEKSNTVVRLVNTI